MVKILHAADFHLDSPFDSLSPDKAAQRRKEQRILLKKIADLAESEQVQLVLLAGDLLDSNLSYYETEEVLTNILGNISANVFISPGNHDYFGPGSPYYSMKLPENVHIFMSTAIRSVDIPNLNCRVWGAGFNADSCPPLLNGFKVPRSDFINIMVIHGDVGGMSDKYNPISLEAIAGTGLDYIALGHIHKYSGILKSGSTFYAYPGCPEGRGFDETGRKGCIIGTVGKGECCLDFVPVQGRKYEVLYFDITGKNNIADELIRILPADSERDIYRIVLTGESAAPPDTAKIHDRIAGHFFDVSIRDKTVPTRDIWQDVQSDTLKGLFLRKMLDKYNSTADEEEHRKIMLAVHYGLAAMENREEPLP